MSRNLVSDRGVDVTSLLLQAGTLSDYMACVAVIGLGGTPESRCT